MNLTLFDLDGTLLPIDSDHAFGEFLVALGWADARRTSRAATTPSTPTTWPAGSTSTPTSTSPPRPGATAPPAELARGQRALHATRWCARCCTRRRWRWCSATSDAGDLLAIVTATNDFVTRPIADAVRRRRR